MNDLSLRIWSYNLEGATVTKFRQKCSEVERGKPHERETQTYGRGTFPEESRTRDEAQMYFCADRWLSLYYCPVRSKEQNMAYRALFTGFNLTLKAVLEGRSASFKVGVRPG